jgi:hypothetical protein
MTRLNATVSDSFVSEPSQAQNLLSDLLNEVMRGMTATSDIKIGSDALPSHVEDFFRNYYVKHDLAGSLPPDIGAISEPLASGEAELLRFMLSGDLRHEKVYILCDHAGKGKSTLAKYLCWYLIPREVVLRDAVVPVYISVFDHTERMQSLQNRDEVERYLDDEIQRLAFSHAYDHFCVHSTQILSEAHRSTDVTLQGLFPRTTVDAASANPANWFASQPAERRRRIVFYALMHFARTVRPVVIVLDDADRLQIDTQRFALEYLYRRISLGACGILAMRRSTYSAMKADIRDKEHHLSQPIRWSPDSVKDMLTRRIATADQRVTLRWGMRTDTTARDLADAFVNALRRPDAVELLTALSNENLHSLFGKLHMITQSRYFRDGHVMRELIVKETSRHGEASAGAQLWIVLSFIFGNYAGTFKSSEDAGKAGIINVFCTRELNHSPLTQFIRLNLLARVFPIQREADALPVKTIREEYMSIFGDDAHFTPVFARALRRLIVGGLVFTTSCRRYQDEQAFWPNVTDDSIFVAPAGRYYLQKLIGFIEYLWFMKDDIDWRDSPTLTLASTTANTVKKARGTLRALVSLMKLECEMLESIRASVTPGMPLLRRYTDLFSARRIPGSHSVLFTDFMCERFSEFLGAKFPDYSTVLAKQLGALDDVREAYARTRAAFS